MTAATLLFRLLLEHDQACASRPWPLDRLYSGLACWNTIGSDAPMRTILTIACASVVFAAGAQAQDALKSCRQIKDDGRRLKCYDGLDTSSANATARPADSKPGSTAWVVNDEKSPLDDSPLVSAALPSSDGKAHLLMRCKDRKTELAVSIRGFIKCGTDIPVTYRIDQAQATEAPWHAHSSCYLAVAPSPIPLIRAFADQGKVYFRMFDHHGAAYDVLFNLGKVSEIRSRLAEACDWEGTAKATENPASKPPAPAASPSAPKATPK
jgi:Type VI secretion system VasI, EvfG, VC_A0118